MKKILFVAVLALASVMAYAQPRAIGVRLGAFDGVSYEHAIGDNNMIEIEAGFGWYGRFDTWYKEPGRTIHNRAYGNNIQVAATFDWIDPFGATFPTLPKGEFHWYMGVGATGGYGWYSYGWAEDPTGTYYGWFGGDYNWGFAAAAGRVGVEYNFWFPLQLSLDWRPTLGTSLGEAYDVNGNKTVKAGLYWEMTSVALGVRYKF